MTSKLTSLNVQAVPVDNRAGLHVVLLYPRLEGVYTECCVGYERKRVIFKTRKETQQRKNNMKSKKKPK